MSKPLVLNSNTAGKKKIDKAREQSYKELAERTKRVNALERAGRELDTQRNLMVYPFFFFFLKKRKEILTVSLFSSGQGTQEKDRHRLARLADLQVGSRAEKVGNE